MPDMEVKFDLNTSRKANLYMTSLIYSPSKKTALPEANYKVQDIVLDRAVEILKARNSFGALTNINNEQKELTEQEKTEEIKEETNK